MAVSQTMSVEVASVAWQVSVCLYRRPNARRTMIVAGVSNASLVSVSPIRAAGRIMSAQRVRYVETVSVLMTPQSAVMTATVLVIRSVLVARATTRRENVRQILTVRF